MSDDHIDELLAAGTDRIGHVAYDLATEVKRLRSIIDSPDPQDFLAASQAEAKYQRTIRDDSWKTDEDWFWLIGFLAGKALHRPGDDSPRKLMHRITTIAAAAANWHHAVKERTATAVSS